MVQIVWFKRDLRIHDNVALSTAASQGKVLPLYIVEPKLWAQPDLSHRHYVFLKQCLVELHQELQSLGQGLIIKVGEAVDVLEKLAQEFSVNALWSHQETWNGWTYDRDKAVKAWAQKRGIPWNEPAQNGVVRRLKDRNQWAHLWYQKMKQPVCHAPKKLLAVEATTEQLPLPRHLGLEEDGCIYPQRGGRREGLKELHSFLHERGEHYTKAMSSPVTAFESCSRISPHLAFGTLSMKQVFQEAEKRRYELDQMPDKGRWPSAVRSFSSRLRWHCHFMQKLEDQPSIEFKAMHSQYDLLRNEDNEQYLKAWQEGKTGYPLIDACMRALIATGWINFRMRAMLMSFASYHLWLDWRRPALHLARLFIDYEPGIHYSQVQMQSGTTGMNTIRIYNPIKQSQDQDPEGAFIYKWVPELKQIKKSHIHTPWLVPDLMGEYPTPIVEEKKARKNAADKIYVLKKETRGGSETRAVIEKHASRKKPPQRKMRTPRHEGEQLELPLK